MLALWLAAPLVLWAAAPAPAPHYPVRIALLSDVHLNRGTNQVLFREHLGRAMEAVNAAGVDLVLIAGDLTEDGTPEEYDEFRRCIQGFHVPAWSVPGNHDVGNKPVAALNQRANSLRVARYELKLGPSWFVREHAGVRVIGLNSQLLGSRLSGERKQWKMLEQALAKPADKPTILLCHLPLFLKQPDEPGGDYWNVEPGPRERLLSLLKLGGVSTVLSGHLHRPLTNSLDGIFFYTTPPVSFGLPAKKQRPGWTLVTVPQKGPAEVRFRPIE
jgi:3',5'-cyclic AMP phosphodiesterase CpdA